MSDLNKQTDIFVEMGLEKLPEEDKKAFLDDFMQALQYKMIIKLDSVLTLEQKQEFNKISELSGDNNEKVMEFLYNNIPNYNDLLNQEAISLREEMIQDAKNINNAILNK